jgi:hypothetical protein
MPSVPGLFKKSFWTTPITIVFFAHLSSKGETDQFLRQLLICQACHWFSYFGLAKSGIKKTHNLNTFYFNQNSCFYFSRSTTHCAGPFCQKIVLPSSFLEALHRLLPALPVCRVGLRKGSSGKVFRPNWYSWFFTFSSCAL